MKVNNKEQFSGIKPFDFSVTYSELCADSSENINNSHVHEDCEIYINLSGDVSFVVENNIYPVKPGDIIITRPFEYHHCVYHNNTLHKHFWILFSAQENEYLFDTFFKRNLGKSNRLSLPREDTDSLITLCHKMTKSEPQQSIKYYNFFKLINILQNADITKDEEANYPPDIAYALNYINSHLGDQISIREIAKECYVSVNTLERHFREYLSFTPSAYIQKKRLANAAKLLSTGYSVTMAAEQSGFPDYSNFIALFKKTYGITPLKYKKSVLH